MATPAHKAPVKNGLQSPSQCGLPEKFDAWRTSQVEGINVIITSKKRVTGLCMPTGSGKSAVAVAVAKLSGKPTCIVTASRGLQDQYLDDFQSVGMVDLRGRQNYKCDMRPDDPDYTCEDGYAARCPYKGTVACPCSQAEMRAATSSLVVTNYDKWTSARMYGQGLAHIQQVIFDECHHMPEALASTMQVQLHYKEVEDGLKIDFPDNVEDMDTWRVWASAARAVAEMAMLAAQQRIRTSDPKPTWVKHFTHMRNLSRRLGIIATARSADWVVDGIEGGYQFDPIRPGRYAEAALLLKVPRIIAISASARPKTMYASGIAQGNFDFQEFDSDFDPKRSPIYYKPTMRVDARASSLASLWVLLDQIASRRRDRKGMVQTISYDRQQEILRTSRYASSMFYNSRGDVTSEIVKSYMLAGPGSIIVSPSIGTGYDFKDDASRWNFICKIPFQPPSKINKAREVDDAEYGPYKAMQGLVQMFGRDKRSKEDWSEGFIGDEHMEWFIPRYAHLAPRSFHMFLKRVDVLPQPPAL